MISIRDLTYVYPNAQSPALNHISWEVADGEFVLVAGPSGSGKSSLLRAINGLIPHFNGGKIAGSVFIDGIDVIASGPQRLSQSVGFVSQDPESQAVLDKVEGEIAFALENAAIPPTEMRIRVEEALDLLGLTALRERSLQSLSGGERQRLSIASALALRPHILVLDEPTSQLDPRSAEDVLRALVRLNEDLGLSIVLAEHRLERILRHVDRLTWLDGGHIVADGSVRDVFALVDAGPPIVRLGRAMGWKPLPLTVKEGKPFAREMSIPRNEPDEAPSLPKTPLLEVQGLQFAYNGQQTLMGVNLRINAGEIVALVGRNGAGKSTLLKCIAGLLQPKAGGITVAGRSTENRRVADICRDVGYLPQNPDDLLFAESVEDELRVTIKNHRLVEDQVVLDDLLNRLGLADLGDAYPRDLSVGQRQRVAIGAVTVTRPRLILLDEPTRGLDSDTKSALVKIWQDWAADGAAILLVTHDVELAAQVAHSVVMLSDGEVIAAGSTREILSNSPYFAPQIARLFPGSGWLTPADVLKHNHQ